MSKINYIMLLLSMLSLYSCKKDYQFQFDSPKKLKLNQTLNLELKEKNNQKIDKITYSLDGKSIENPKNVNVSSLKLGKHTVSALVFYENKSKKLTNTFTLLSDKKYEVYTYKVINTYPHDTKAYTQGLEFHNGFLYESTGRKGQSSLRKVELKTGKVIQQIDVPKEYFAEGMTLYNDKIYQLTWQAKKGFIYKLEDFEKIGEFNYNQSLEGWGLALANNIIYKSDGTSRIWKLDPKTLEEKGFIDVYTNTQELKELNELEYINGKLYSNVWMKNVISIINPENGAVEGVADLNGLVKDMKNSQHLTRDDVLNGIAYDKEGDRLFVTGKYWSKLFEIELIKK